MKTSVRSAQIIPFELTSAPSVGMKLSVDIFALQHSFNYLVTRPWTFWDRTDILGQDAHSGTRRFRQRKARTQTKKLYGTGRTFWDRTDILGQDGPGKEKQEGKPTSFKEIHTRSVQGDTASGRNSIHIASDWTHRHGAWLCGVHRTRRDGSSFTWPQPCNNQTALSIPLRWIFENALY